MTKAKNIGIDVKAPEKECQDKKCPFHGEVKPRGKMFTGVVLARDTHGTATVEWSYKITMPKFERAETRRTKIRVHNPDCIDATEGDIVRIAETRPLSKTKNFVIIENLGKEKGFVEKMEAREEATVEGEKAPEKAAAKKEDSAETEKVSEGETKEESSDDNEGESPQGSSEAGTEAKEEKPEEVKK